MLRLLDYATWGRIQQVCHFWSSKGFHANSMFSDSLLLSKYQCISYTRNCFEAGLFFTPALQQELNILSPQGLYDTVYPEESVLFWEFFVRLFEVLHDQVCCYNLHDIWILWNIFLECQGSISPSCFWYHICLLSTSWKCWTKGVYYSACLLCVLLSGSSAWCPTFCSGVFSPVFIWWSWKIPFYQKIFQLASPTGETCTLIPPLCNYCYIFPQTLFCGWLVGLNHHLIWLSHANQNFPSVCLTEDEFNSYDVSVRSCFSDILSTLICIAHVLPLACKSEKVLEEIFDSNNKWLRKRTFHQIWTLNGWCDHVIQPARDAVLEYYKVCAYNILLHVELIERNYLFSATQVHRMLRVTCTSVTCASHFLNFCIPPVDPSWRLADPLGYYSTLVGHFKNY